MPRTLLPLLLTATLVAIIPACGGPAPPTVLPPTVVPKSTVGLTDNPISDEEAAEFSQRFIAGLKSGNQSKLSEVLDLDMVAARTMQGIELSNDEFEAMRKRILVDLTSESGLSGQVATVLASGGSYRQLQVHEVDGHKRVLLRLLAPQSGVNYHDVVLNKTDDGKIRAVDVHVVLTGEMLSETMKRILIPLAARQNPSLLERLTPREKSVSARMKDILRMMDSVSRNSFADALATFDRLPTDVKTEKFVLLLRLRAAREPGYENIYNQAIEDFRLHHADDPCIALLSIDYHLTRNEFDRALKSIEEVDKAVGSDPYLNVLRAIAADGQKDPDEARRLLAASIESDPGIRQAWVGLISLDLRRKAFPEVLRSLKEMDRLFQPKWTDVATNEAYAEFAKSPQYGEWTAYLKSKAR